MPTTAERINPNKDHRTVHTNHRSIRPGSQGHSGKPLDMACALLGHTAQPTAVREAIAKRILVPVRRPSRT